MPPSKILEARASPPHVTNSFLGSNREQFLAIFDRLAILDQAAYDFATHVSFDVVHQLHGFNDAQHLAGLYDVSRLHKRRRAGRRRLVVSAHHWRTNHMKIFAWSFYWNRHVRGCNSR